MEYLINTLALIGVFGILYSLSLVGLFLKDTFQNPKPKNPGCETCKYVIVSSIGYVPNAKCKVNSFTEWESGYKGFSIKYQLCSNVNSIGQCKKFVRNC